MNRQYINNFSNLRLPVIAALWVICFILCAKHSFAYEARVDKATNHTLADTARFTITGKVVDDTGHPLPGATVFISNSKWAAATGNDGEFNITGLPAGSYELSVRMMGFITFTKAAVITDKSLTINVNLKTDAVALSEVKITAKPDGNRARYLKTFTEIFLGRSDNAKKSKILNSDVIKFSYDNASGTLTARSIDFIKVDNAALGYNVNYLLNSFSFNQNDQGFAYDGKVYFAEQKSTEQKQQVWKKNRSSTYYGSMQHFFKALSAGTSQAEGFSIYKIADSELGRSASYNLAASARTRSINGARTVIDRANLKPVKPDSLYKRTGGYKVLNLPLLVNNGDTTRFYICYTRNRESTAFLSAGMHLNIPVPNAQISSVYQITSGNIILNKDGSLLPEKSLLLQGYWAWQRVADMLPNETELPSQLANANGSATEGGLLAKSALVEKIHLQMDRPWYLTGDTAWMKLYVVDAYNRPATDSKVCFVELIDKNKRIVKNLRLPLTNGIAIGELALSDSLIKKGAYVLRAYTNNTQKNNNSFFYKTLRIAGLNSAASNVKKTNLSTPALGSAADSIKLQFFPEGGALVADINSRVAVKVTASGKPVNKMPGYITDEAGSPKIQFETNAQGISTFNLTPLKQGKYWAVVTLPNGQEKRFALPQPQQSGIVMSVVQSDDDIAVHLNAANVYKTQLSLTVSANNRVEYRTEKLLALTIDSIVIPKTDLPEGIIQFDLYNADKTLVAARTVYNLNKTQQLKVSLVPSKTLYRPHDKVDLNVAVTDENGNPVSGNFSVSVNNEADLPDNAVDKKTILTAMLMPDKELQKLNQYDLTALTTNRQRELDDMLLTVKRQLSTLDETTNELPQPEAISSAIKGRVVTSKGKPAPLSVVGLFFTAGGSVLTTTSDNNGRFTFENITVKNGDPFYIVAKDKSKDLIVTVDKYVPPVIPERVLADTAELNEINAYLFERITELKNQNLLGTELKEVLIKEKKAEPTLKELVRLRSSNLGGTPDQVLTFIDLLDCHSGTLGGCLALKLNGVTLTDKTDSLHRPQLIANGRYTQPMAVFVDGIERPDALATLPPSTIASIEVLKGSNAAAYGFKSGFGVVVVTTKGGDLDYWTYEQEHYVPGSTKIPPVRLYRFENGFDLAKDFYLPDYTTTTNSIDKWRPTIYWNPNLLTGTDGKAQLSYFTNSAPGTYRITIEGIDGNGRIARQVFKYTVSN